MATNAVDEVKPMAFDPLKAQVGLNVAKATLDCCAEQYKHVQKNPVTIRLYEDSIRQSAL